MDKQNAAGSCLCGKVAYRITGSTGIFQYCFCSRCRKFTGSAHAANIIVGLDQFTWLRGEDQLGYYAVEAAKHFATCFCKHCGASMPWRTQSNRSVVVPAGTLDDDPGLKPKQSLFCASAASWYQSPDDLPAFDEMPPRNKPS